MGRPRKLDLSEGSDDWKKMRKLATKSIPGKHSALYYLNSVVLQKGPLVPMTYRAHFGLCLFAEGMTGIKEIDDCRIKLILVPRGVGKSSLVTKALPLLRLLQDPEYACGIANEKQDLANTFLQDIKAELESNELLRALFPEIVPPGWKPKTWAADRVITKRKKENPTSPTMLATGTTGTVTGVHMNMWVCDDILSQNAAENAHRGSFTEIEAINRWTTRLQPLLKNPKKDPILFIGCIEENQPVLMANGLWKPIKDIQIGDEVWAAKKDGSEGYKARKVTGVWPQGESEIVEVNIAGRQLLCTPDHPILKATGRSDGVGRTWKGAKDLKGLCRVFTDKLDSEPADDMAWLLGFLIGDGWNTRSDRPNGDVTYSVCFSPGIDEELNQKAIDQLAALAPKSKVYTTKVGTIRTDATALGRRLETLGLIPGVGAKLKSVPEWIFTVSRETNREFLRGLGDADGHWLHENRYALEVISEQLVKDVHLLAMSCGVKPSRITSRTRTIQPPHSPKLVESTSYHVALNFNTFEEETHRYIVKGVTPAGTANTYDLSVEDGDCYFVASGMNVGNTKWWEGDTYEFVEDFYSHGEDKKEFLLNLSLPAQTGSWDDGGVEVPIDRPPEHQSIRLYKRDEIAVFKFPAIDEAGRAIFPERYDLEVLQTMQQEDPVFFAGQYLLDPTSGAASHFDAEWLKYYTWDGNSIVIKNNSGVVEHISKQDLAFFISVDPAFSKKHTAARTAIPVMATDGKRLFLIEDFAARMDDEDAIANKVYEFFLEYNPTKIFVETIVAQVVVANAIRRTFRANGIDFDPIEEIKSHGKASKQMRIYGLQNYFKRGNFYVNKVHTKFIQEYTSFPRGNLRDLLDAIAFQKDEWERLFLADHVGSRIYNTTDRRAAEEEAMDRVRTATTRRRGRRRK